ncbi:hypothetical protein GJ744_000281 [Endocarpon pusillum]|uniref:Uncharacterized protein n=1 Tax=Endocarpon pusillum TaxID=364733 RepID=A0A8H7AQY6_9EURO|nr:hypothetical protein GJ744_000281 [Endocarpon pusillum]
MSSTAWTSEPPMALSPVVTEVTHLFIETFRLQMNELAVVAAKYFEQPLVDLREFEEWGEEACKDFDIEPESWNMELELKDWRAEKKLDAFKRGIEQEENLMMMHLFLSKYGLCSEEDDMVRER